MDNIGIYVHVPFCIKKCPYCNFYSIPPNETLVDKYVNTVLKIIENFGSNLGRKADTIYFGGGTPGLIGNKNIGRIIEQIRRSFGTGCKEITLEVNPFQHRQLDFEYLKAVGVNRLSIGVQSVNNAELLRLGRMHNFYDVECVLDICRKYNFKNFSVDLMVGIPKQSRKSFEQSINFCIYNKIPHVSTYLLKIERGTQFFYNINNLALMSDDDQAELYLLLSEKLKNAGYSHYEVSNFCLNGYESQHNLKYWECGEYFGVGPSAHSFLNKKRLYYISSLGDFLNNPMVYFDGYGGDAEEYVMLRLRLSEGLSNKKFKNKFGYSIPEKYYFNAKKYVDLHFVEADRYGIRLSDRGFLVSNKIISDILF